MSADAALDAVARLRPLPPIAGRVLQVVSGSVVSTDELLAVVRSADTLTRHLVRLSNSAVHDLPRRITDVSQTVAYLGAGNLIRMVVCMCISPYYRGTEAANAEPARALWCHSVASGIAAERLADATGATHPGAAFAAGVLHNIGKLPLLAAAQQHDRALRAQIGDELRCFLDVERAVLGIDHAVAGGVIADRWGLPTSLRQAIRHHHNPDLISTNNEMAALVHVADLVAVQAGFTAGVEALNYSICCEALSRLHLHAAAIDRLRISIADELQRAQDLMRLGYPSRR